MTAVKEAFKDAGLAKYIPTRHAIDRARIRFGINAEHVTDWINAIMEDAKFVSHNGRNGLIYESEDVRIIIDETTNAVITVHHALSTSFLRPALEREKRKIDRIYTRQKRALELQYAEALRDLSEMAINRARARNPKTRELIADRMANMQTDIDGFVHEIERVDDEHKAKIRAIELIVE